MTRISASRAVSLLLLGLSFAVLYHHVISKLVHDWSNDGNYSHGFLMVPLALYVVWERRAVLSRTRVRPSGWGLFWLVVSMGLLLGGVLGAELFLTRISLVLAVASLVLFLFGRSYLRVLGFPMGLLLLMVPLPAIIFNQVAFPLQILASRTGEAALSVLQIPVLREGNVITLANTTLEVAEACSGIRSLISLFALALIYGYFTESRLWARIVLAAASVPVAIVSNGVRVAGTGIAAHYIGPAAGEGFFHTFSGWLLFIVAFSMLFAVQRTLSATGPLSRTLADGDQNKPVAAAHA